MPSESLGRSNSVPPIVGIVVTQAVRHRAEGLISEAVFNQQIRRIALEEMDAKGLTLLVRTLPHGRLRILIKEKNSGPVRDMLDFAADGTPEKEDEMPPVHPERPSSA